MNSVECRFTRIFCRESGFNSVCHVISEITIQIPNFTDKIEGCIKIVSIILLARDFLIEEK